MSAKIRKIAVNVEETHREVGKDIEPCKDIDEQWNGRDQGTETCSPRESSLETVLTEKVILDQRHVLAEEQIERRRRILKEWKRDTDFTQ